MTDYERKKIEMELKVFASKHLEKPSEYRNPDQVRFYVKAMAKEIETLKKKCNYAPPWAYTMPAQCNAMQNSLLFAEFTNSYR
jgi:hypothetical protein